MRIRKVIIGIFIASVLLNTKVLAATYVDVPEKHWAASVIKEANLHLCS